MKQLLQTLLFFLLVTQICFAQWYQEDNVPKKNMLTSHDPNLKSIHKKSFYKQKADWQYIIDTTWGMGLPLAQKQSIFNTFVSKLDAKFDGFETVGLNLSSWDSLKNYYYSKINAATSRGRFSAIMNYLSSKLRDRHTYAEDNGVINTPLNPGVPFLMITGYFNAAHFGAVTTCLPDSSVLVLRVIDNHPLNLGPGDIILGYEGVPWKDLVVELMEAELPNYDWWGNSNSAFVNNLFVPAGMNWHLFDTIDILKYSTGDTVHLSVAPLASLNLQPMLNNEQMIIPNIPFPGYYNGQLISYGIMENTNIGYIYVYSHTPFAQAETQFNQAVAALQNTDAMIIDMRWTWGGWALWEGAFNILANEKIYTLSTALRCNSTNFTLCPTGDLSTYLIDGTAPTKYDGPIALLLGPTCGSMGDINAYRLKYLYNVRTFGKSTWAGLGHNEAITSVSGWTMNYSIENPFHINDPGYYLNGKEFPIDFPIWHNPDDVALGKDAVVDKALDWINNLVYPYNTMTDKGYYSPIVDTVHLSTTIENPNSHQLSARAYLKTVEGVLIDSVDLIKQALEAEGENWKADFTLPPTEELYKVAITVLDETASEHFTVPNATRFTTAGRIKLDSIRFLKGITSYYNLRPFVRNEGTSLPISNAKIQLRCSDPWVSSIAGAIDLPSIAPGASVGASSWIAISYYASNFPGYFNLKAEMSVDGWIYWMDSIRINVITGVEDEVAMPSAFKLEQNYPNPFNPSTKISWQSPVSSWQTLKVFDVLGNEVATLVNEEKEAGSYEVEFSAGGGQESGNRNLASAIYFYQLRAGSFVETKKMLLLR